MKGNKAFLRLAIPLGAIVIAGGIIYALYANKPKTRKRKPRHIVPIVEAIKISPGSEQIHIEASGTVIAAREVVITTEVEGKIIRQHRELVPGGLLAKGEELVKVDPAEYELLVEERRAALDEEVSRMDIEKGQQLIAREEWRLFEKDNAASDTNKSLALRVPHLKIVEAQVEADKSRLAAAELDLKKTSVTVPFNAVVVEEYAELGQFVGRQTKIATIAGTDYFWVQASILPAHLDRISFPSRERRGSEVRVVLGSSRGKEVVRKGHVEKLLAGLDPKGRMARILIRIDDPLNLKAREGEGRVLLESFVKLEIEAGTMDDVYTIPREALADGDRLLILKEDGTLDIRGTNVKWRRKNELLLTADIGEGERLIISRLQTPLPGMKLRTGDERPVNKKGAPKKWGKKKGAKK
ncbi:MAG: HlyD family efflux transporter periplasmic adaptor subunit [Proteobacteria bacterium]|nr:HlyD family efflux transporter periplasmic adaptor subunit [Pseudomonadota bacterium]